MLSNTQSRYGLVHVIIHWLVALVVFGMFAVGVWMVELDYYSEWYKSAPFYHKSVGILLFMVMLLRIAWKWLQTSPQPIETHTQIERIASKTAHLALYGLIFMVMLSGYFISTADGRPIEVFDWFSVGALDLSIENQEDVAGEIHEWLAYGLIALVVIHALAALKHHFIDKDKTLVRMFGKS